MPCVCGTPSRSTIQNSGLTVTLAFVDTETTGLDPDLHQIWEVGLIVDDQERRWFLSVDLGRADSFALKVGQFHDRHPDGHDFTFTVAGSGYVHDRRTFAREFAKLTYGRHLVGAVVSFDAERLSKLLKANGACPEWHYHLVDVEALAAGWLLGQSHDSGEATDLHVAVPPWNSNELSLAVGVDPANFDRHTALGDARWAKAIYDIVIHRQKEGD